MYSIVFIIFVMPISSILFIACLLVILELFHSHLSFDLVLLNGITFLLLSLRRMELTMKINLKNLVINMDADFIKIVECPVCYSKS